MVRKYDPIYTLKVDPGRYPCSFGKVLFSRTPPHSWVSYEEYRSSYVDDPINFENTTILTRDLMQWEKEE